jgi:hypothetical protein
MLVGEDQSVLGQVFSDSSGPQGAGNNREATADWPEASGGEA